MVNLVASYIDDVEEWQKGFSFYSEMVVRFSETDLFGHLNNTVPFVYFEQARVEFMQYYDILVPTTKGFNHDYIPVVADLQCDFVQQVYFSERIKVYTKLAHVGKSSMDFHYMGCNDKGELCFTGRGALVQFSQAEQKSMPFSEEQRAHLLAILA